jgi:bacterioferritin (cytochrome b1)
MKSYRYAGIKNLDRPGIDVQACASRIHHLAYAEERLFLLQAVHIISTPERDVKILLARLQYEDAQHADLLKSRLLELRISDRKAYGKPDESLDIVFDEAMHCRTTVELLAVLVKVFKPALLDSYRKYLALTNGLADYASVRILKRIVSEEEETFDVLNEAYRDIVNTSEKEAQAQSWTKTISDLLSAAGGIDGTSAKKPAAIHPVRAKSPYLISRKLTRDDSFPRVWDFIHVENQKISERLAQMICTRLGETTIAEALTGVLWEVKNQPWDFYVAVSRHLWDEMRHSMFGELAIEDLFQNRAALPLREFEAAYLFEMKPLELYATLGHVESSLMKYPPGKREEYEFCRDSARYPLMTTLQDFDWADEVLHVHIARSQLKGWFKGTEEELRELAEKGYEFRARARAQQSAVSLPDLTDRLAAKATGPIRDSESPNLKGDSYISG